MFVALETFAYWIVSPKEPAELSSLTRLVFPIPSQIIQLSLVERWEVVDGSSPLIASLRALQPGWQLMYQLSSFRQLCSNYRLSLLIVKL